MSWREEAEKARTEEFKKDTLNNQKEQEKRDKRLRLLKDSLVAEIRSITQILKRIEKEGILVGEMLEEVESGSRSIVYSWKLTEPTHEEHMSISVRAEIVLKQLLFWKTETIEVDAKTETLEQDIKSWFLWCWSEKRLADIQRMKEWSDNFCAPGPLD